MSPRARLPSLPPLAWASLATVYVLWGSTYLGIRVAIETLPPMLMAGARFIVAGGILYAIAVRRGDRTDRPAPRHWLSAFVIGGALMLGGNGGVVWAEQHIDSGTAALLVATVPLWMALFAWLFLRERIPPAAVAGIVVGFGGTGLLVGQQSGGAGDSQVLGALVVVGAAMSWAAGSLYARRAPLPRRPLVGAAMEMIGGGVLMIVVGAAAGELGRLDLAGISLASALGWGHLVVFGSVVAFSAYMWLLHSVPTQIVATYAYVNPVVAVLLGWAFVDEVVTGRTLVASAIIVAAVAIIVTARTPRQAEIEEAPSPANAPPVPLEDVKPAGAALAEGGGRSDASSERRRTVRLSDSPPERSSPPTKSAAPPSAHAATVRSRRRRGAGRRPAAPRRGGRR